MRRGAYECASRRCRTGRTPLVAVSAQRSPLGLGVPVYYSIASVRGKRGAGGAEVQPEADHKLLEDRELLLDLFLEADEGLRYA